MILLKKILIYQIPIFCILSFCLYSPLLFTKFLFTHSFILSDSYLVSLHIHIIKKNFFYYCNFVFIFPSSFCTVFLFYRIRYRDLVWFFRSFSYLPRYPYSTPVVLSLPDLVLVSGNYIGSSYTLPWLFKTLVTNVQYCTLLNTNSSCVCVYIKGSIHPHTVSETTLVSKFCLQIFEVYLK